MSKQLTKAQLLSELEAARIENQRLSAVNESLRTRATGNSNRRVVSFTRRTTPEQEAAHDAYVRALLVSREEAARTGRTVVVRRPS